MAVPEPHNIDSDVEDRMTATFRAFAQHQED
jgi:hypothetical protein